MSSRMFISFLASCWRRYSGATVTAVTWPCQFCPWPSTFPKTANSAFINHKFPLPPLSPQQNICVKHHVVRNALRAILLPTFALHSQLHILHPNEYISALEFICMTYLSMNFKRGTLTSRKRSKHPLNIRWRARSRLSPNSKLEQACKYHFQERP